TQPHHASLLDRRMSVCAHVFMYSCIHVFVYACMYVCAHAYVCVCCMFPQECCVCPNTRDRAFKRTTTNEWIHAACAMWITGPEFVDIETLEPVRRVNHIKKHRRQLV